MSAAVKAAILIHEDDSLTYVQRTVLDAKFGAGEQSKVGVTVNGEVAAIENGKAVNPATGQPITSVPGYVSELATLLTGKQSVDAGKANPTQSEGDKETRQQYALMNGMHIDLPAPTKRTVYELFRPSDGSRAEVALHVKGASGKVRVELAGATSGAVVGGASLGGAEGTIMEGALDSYRKESNGGDFDINLRLDGGDAKVLLVLTPA